MQGHNVANKWRTPAVQRIMKDHEGTKYRRVIAMLRGESRHLLFNLSCCEFFFSTKRINFAKKYNAYSKMLNKKLQKVDSKIELIIQ